MERTSPARTPKSCAERCAARAVLACLLVLTADRSAVAEEARAVVGAHAVTSDDSRALVTARAAASNVLIPGLAVELSTWADQPAEGDSSEATLSLGLLRYRSPQAQVVMIAGRQLFALGPGGLQHADALTLRVVPVDWLSLDAIAGTPVDRGNLDGAWIAGGRATIAPTGWAAVWGAALAQRHDSVVDRDRLAVGLDIGRFGAPGVSAAVELDPDDGRAGHAQASALLPIGGGYSLEGRWRRDVDAWDLPEDSVIAIFADGASQESRGTAAWSGVIGERAIRVEAGGGARAWNDKAWRPQAGARAIVGLSRSGAGPANSGWLAVPTSRVIAEVDLVDGPGGGYLLGRAGLDLAIRGPWRTGGQARVVRFDADSPSPGASGGGGAYVSWGEDGWSVAASVDGDKGVASGQAEVRGLIRLAFSASTQPQIRAPWTAPAWPAPRGDRIRPGHATHAANDLACDDCHSAIAARPEPAGVDRRPQRSLCEECHTVVHDDLQAAADAPERLAELRAEMEDCDRCHTSPNQASPRSREAPERELTFSHAPHLTDEAACASCHAGASDDDDPVNLTPPMDSCRGCHEPAFARTDCRMCHPSLPEASMRPASAFSHEAAFLPRHGRLAVQPAASCGSCHDQGFCADCHARSAPARLEVLLPDRNDRAFVHRGDYVARHSLDAASSSASCTGCHGVSTCVECHSRQGVASTGRLGSAGRSPHPIGYADPGSYEFHATQARQGIMACAACHDRGDQTTCVRCHAAGGLARSPHPAGWSTPDRRSARVRYAPCISCHSN